MSKGYKELKRKDTRDSGGTGGKVRTIPASLKIKIIFVNPLMFMGFAFAIGPLIMLFVFGSQINFDDNKIDQNLTETKGIITDVRPTNTSINDMTVMENFFEYTLPGGKKYESSSYTTGMYYNRNEEVTVEYSSENPEIARVQGTRKSIFKIWILLMVIPFLFSGFVMFFIRGRFNVRAIRTLQYGQIAYGKLVDKIPTNTSINNQTVYRMIFEFTAADGQVYRAEAKTHHTYNLEDEPTEKLVYEMRAPQKAVLIDSLPRQVKDFFQNIS